MRVHHVLHTRRPGVISWLAYRLDTAEQVRCRGVVERLLLALQVPPEYVFFFLKDAPPPDISPLPPPPPLPMGGPQGGGGAPLPPPLRLPDGTAISQARDIASAITSPASASTMWTGSRSRKPSTCWRPGSTR